MSTTMESTLTTDRKGGWITVRSIRSLVGMQTVMALPPYSFVCTMTLSATFDVNMHNNCVIDRLA